MTWNRRGRLPWFDSPRGPVPQAPRGVSQLRAGSEVEVLPALLVGQAAGEALTRQIDEGSPDHSRDVRVGHVIGGAGSAGYGLHPTVGDGSREDPWGVGPALMDPPGAEVHL